MKKFIQELLSPFQLMKDARFLWLFFLSTVVLVQDWGAYEALMKTFCVFYMLFGIAHFVRRLVFPGLDMSAIARRAAEDGHGGIVFFALMAFYVSLVFIPIYWLKP